jgi:hypothetical protein
MWIFRFMYCIFQGHAFIDITNSVHPYQYCMHCGKVKEPSSYGRAVPVHVRADERNMR